MEIYRNLEFMGFPNYEISNYGNVISLNYAQSKKPKLLTPLKKKGGYLGIHFSKEGKQYSFAIHRLVAVAFIPNPNELSEVNHIDEDKTNNRVENLQWVTPKQNSNHGTRNERLRIAGKNRVCSDETREKIRQSKLGDKNPMKRPEVRLKNSLSHIGKPSPKKGKPMKEDAKQKMIETKRRNFALKNIPMPEMP